MGVMRTMEHKRITRFWGFYPDHSCSFNFENGGRSMGVMRTMEHKGLRGFWVFIFCFQSIASEEPWNRS